MSARGKAGCSSSRRELLAWAAVLGAVTCEALARVRGVSPAAARSALAAAERDGQMRAWRLLRGEPALHTVTASGLRAAGLTGLAPVRLGPGGARHAAACCAAAVSLADAFPGCEVLGEPAVRRCERDLGATFAVLGARPPGAGRGHRPDLLLMPASRAVTLPVAVEVELTVKAPDRLAAVCVAYARSRSVSGVLYLAAPEVLGPLARAIGKAGAGDRIVALPLDTQVRGSSVPSR